VKPEGTIPLELYPIELRNARRFIADNHSHAGEPRAWRFGVGVLAGGELVGVGIAARPKAGGLDSGRALEITRVATIGTPNACSRIYAALCRAGGALGYVEAWTYTLEGECASCPRAAGFVEDPPPKAEPRSWNRPHRVRVELNLFGETTTPLGPKRRWRRELRP